jgi:dsDNA-specific endonuclease/ATPase MutS2
VVEKQHNSINTLVKEYTDNIENADTETEEIKKKNEELKFKVIEASLVYRTQKEGLRDYESRISSKIVEKLHKKLDSKNPQFVSRMCESLVALIRCVNNVVPSDVEEYIGNYEGLKFKMQNINPADVPVDCVDINQAKLDALSTYFRDIYS